jgi:hypothetical protein
MLASLSGFGTMYEHRGGYMLKSVAEAVQEIEHLPYRDRLAERARPAVVVFATAACHLAL